MKKICVIGSLNIDLTVRVPRFHLPGETIFGTDFHAYTGGKGGNQAVAAAKLGADVTMVGCLGNDANAGIYRNLMKELGVHDLVETVPDQPSGTALIEVSDSGENRIVVVPGANSCVSPEMISRNWEAISACDIILIQLEIPLETVLFASEKLHASGRTVILDPAPAVPLPDELLRAADFLTPNETELAVLTGQKTETWEEIEEASVSLLRRGCPTVITKLGARGAFIAYEPRHRPVPGYKVQAIDTTAAGDSFNAGFAVALASGYRLSDSVIFANAVGALSTTAAGAQAAMPDLETTKAFIHSHQPEVMNEPL